MHKSHLLLIIFSAFSISCNKQHKSGVIQPPVKQVESKIEKTATLEIENQSSSHPPISDFIRRIYQDKKGHLWLGTNGDGVIRYNKDSLDYFSLKDGFVGVAVRGIVEDNQGHVWFGTERGLSKYDGENFVNYTEAQGLIHNDIWSLYFDDKGILWIGTLQGVCQFDGNAFTAFELPEVAPDPLRGVSSSKIVNCIMQDSKGAMWFGTPGGAFIYDGHNLTNLSENDGLCNNSVNHILEAINGDIWFATHHQGVSRYDGKAFINFTLEGTIDGTEVWSLYEDGNGHIWFPAENYGVYRYDGQSFSNYYKKDGLITNATQCIYEDREGRFWLGGWMGLFRKDGNTFVSVAKDGPWKK